MSVLKYLAPGDTYNYRIDMPYEEACLMFYRGMGREGLWRKEIWPTKKYRWMWGSFSQTEFNLVYVRYVRYMRDGRNDSYIYKLSGDIIEVDGCAEIRAAFKPTGVGYFCDVFLFIAALAISWSWQEGAYACTSVPVGLVLGVVLGPLFLWGHYLANRKKYFKVFTNLYGEKATAI